MLKTALPQCMMECIPIAKHQRHFMPFYCAGSSAAVSAAAAGSSLTSDEGSAEAAGSASEEVHKVCHVGQIWFRCRFFECTYQVVSQELHDQCGVLVTLLTEGIEFWRIVRIVACVGLMRLTSNGIIESLLGKMTGLIRSIQDLIVEDGEVKSKT